MAKIKLENRPVIEITKDQVNKVLNTHSDRFKTVLFTKKDGSERKMNYRRHVKKHVKGTGRAPKAPGLVNCFDVQIDDHRCFYSQKVHEIRAENKRYIVID